jgi:hypothetical protein
MYPAILSILIFIKVKPVRKGGALNLLSLPVKIEFFIVILKRRSNISSWMFISLVWE